MSRAGHVVLVVDDEPHTREVLRRGLVGAGYQTREAASSVEACRIFGQHRIDAVILDLRMPVLSGFDLLKWLRTEPLAQAQTVPVFILTGHTVTDAEKKTLRRRDGRFIKVWGRHGAGPGEFDQPHDISIGGSQGRVFVADRENNRVQIFDQDGNFIAAWKQFGRPSAVFVSKDDTLYVSDSQSNSKVNPSATRGITVGSAIDGSLRAFIPDPDLGQVDVNRISGASGITADDMGTIYAADVGTHNLRKYVKVQ